MIINGATLESLRVGLQATFQTAFDETTPEWERFAQRMQTTNDTESFNWLEGMPTVKQWVDDAQFETFSADTWEISWEKWQAGIVVAREDIVDDKLGNVLPRIGDLGAVVRRHPGVRLFQKLKAGDSQVCFDGEYFFDTDHPGSQSNKITGALTSATLNQMKALFSYRRDRLGNLVPSRMTHLVVPPALEMTARAILQPTTLANGATNLDNNAQSNSPVQLIVEPELQNGADGSAVKWYGFDLSRPIKPFVYLEREGVNLDAQDNADSDNVFLRQIYRYNAWYRGDVSYLFWQLAAMSTGV
jgi:phage major head subunit gpT-like protein